MQKVVTTEIGIGGSGAGGGVGVERTHLERKPVLGSRSSGMRTEEGLSFEVTCVERSQPEKSRKKKADVTNEGQSLAGLIQRLGW